MPICDPLYLALLIPVVLVFYFLPAGPWRPVFILLVSYVYYLSFPAVFFPALLFVSAVAYAGGLLIARSRETRFFPSVVTTVLLVCFAPLIFYKYISSLLLTSPDLAGADHGWVLPVGLSFYTFAAAGYLADVALNVTREQRQPLNVALFCGFFPIVTMGPVPRRAMFEQLQFRRGFTADRGWRAFTEILVGAVVKLVFADHLAAPADAVYADLASSPPLEQLVGSIFGVYYVYADWLGYSLLAIGSARLLGVDIPDNFRQPFLSTTIPEFWRSWNISLLNWFRDYIFTPLRLALRRHPRLCTPVAVFVTFVLLGVWHAAGWGYLLYGVANGVLVVLSQWTLARRDRFWRFVGCPPFVVKLCRVPITFLLVTLTLPFVRAANVSEAFHVYGGIFSPRIVANLVNLFRETPDPAMGVFHHIHFGVGFLMIAALVLGDVIMLVKPKFVLSPPILMRAAVCAICLVAVMSYAMSPSTARPFVYFQY
ncbi:MAG TPA: MBOAT family O-acyltransferase [Stellaceae bacterium]|nr:MBOAT family O-acyltransferase [Stellaceae bacterium]